MTTTNLSLYKTTLRLIGFGIIGVAATHLLLGPNAELLLGASISAESLMDPTIDSQNRFYGVAFALFGCMLLLASTDVRGYQKVIVLTFAVFFAAGLSRLVSVALAGWPAQMVILLTIVELLLPPIMLVWLKRLLLNSL